jgi:hypothetical protein
VDSDTCRRVPAPATCHSPDFNPFYGVTGEPNQFDVGGAAVDLNDAKRPMRVLSVARGSDGKLAPVTGVSVSFADTALVPFDRPAFELDGSVATAGDGVTKVLTLKPLAVRQGGVNQAPPAFFVRYVDNNGDGTPDDADGDGAYDLWPRVIVRKLSTDPKAVPGITDENDVDRNGILDAEGAEYESLEGTDSQPDLVVMAAGLVPTALYAALNNTDGTPKRNLDGSLAMAMVPSLTVAIRPAALNAANAAAAPVRLTAVPPGGYAVMLMQFTGQTWRVPNELAPGLSQNLGFPAVESQGFAYVVAPAP